MKTLSKEPRLFPCCICGKPREVRATKKGKPYLHCNPCGLQVFVRVEDGIHRFEALIAKAEANDIWKRLSELQHRYEFKCPKCGKEFWLTEDLIVGLTGNSRVIGVPIRIAMASSNRSKQLESHCLRNGGNCGRSGRAVPSWNVLGTFTQSDKGVIKQATDVTD
jgi:DNA-directed RNA polymerase subunit RPC12/RpoP